MLHRESFRQKYGANFKGAEWHLRPHEVGGWVGFPRPACLPCVVAFPVGLVSSCGVGQIFRPAIFGLSWPLFWPVLRYLLQDDKLYCRGAFVGLWGFSAVVILSACVPCPPVRGKGPFLLSFFALPVLPSVLLSVRPCVRLYIRKKKRPFVWSFPLVVLCLVSPIERKYRRLQAGFLSSLLSLSCRGLPVCLSRWGLQYSINYCGLLPPCGSYNSTLLLSFSWCRAFRVGKCLYNLLRLVCISPLAICKMFCRFGLCRPWLSWSRPLSEDKRHFRGVGRVLGRSNCSK